MPPLTEITLAGDVGRRRPKPGSRPRGHFVGLAGALHRHHAFDRLGIEGGFAHGGGNDGPAHGVDG